MFLLSKALGPVWMLKIDCKPNIEGLKNAHKTLLDETDHAGPLERSLGISSISRTLLMLEEEKRLPSRPLPK